MRTAKTTLPRKPAPLPATEAQTNLRRCIGALRLEVDPSIVEHISAAVEAVIAEANAARASKETTP